MPNGLPSITFLSYFNHAANLLSYLDEEFDLVRHVSRIFLVLVTRVILCIDLPPRNTAAHCTAMSLEAHPILYPPRRENDQLLLVVLDTQPR
jgi:hypothetical protein